MNITVIKRNLEGEESWRYTGRVLRQEGSAIILEAAFNRADTPFMDILIKQGDRFVETFYTDRWYNIFEIHDRDDDRIKGWYCNVGRPAVWEADGHLSYIDLALDLWVGADGKTVVLDEEEFSALDLDPATLRQARLALAELQALFAEYRRPAP